jgi:GntR family transcriptional regulator, rspAB operon transcriptional repressor
MEKIGKVFTNLEDKVYQIIKERIVYHQFKPGERLIDRNIAEELGVSRSMVRHVFSILVKEELIKSRPRNGFYVRIINKEEVEKIYNIRKILEGYATRLAVPRISKIDIDKLEKIFEHARKDLKDSSVKSFIHTDTEFHKAIIENSGNEYLTNTINQYKNHYLFFRVIDLNRIDRARSSYEEHYKIFEVVKQRDAKMASKLMEKHIENAKQIILQNFDNYTFGIVNKNNLL